MLRLIGGKSTNPLHSLNQIPAEQVEKLAPRPVVISSPAYRLAELKQPQDAFAENFCAENHLPAALVPWFALAWLQGQQTERLRNAARLYAELRGAL